MLKYIEHDPKIYLYYQSQKLHDWGEEVGYVSTIIIGKIF